MPACSRANETLETANHNCTSARKATSICEPCWCRVHNTSWDRLVLTVTCADGGLRLCERGGKNAKKRAIVAVARKLAVLLHHLWVSGEVYEPLRNSLRTAAAAAA